LAKPAQNVFYESAKKGTEEDHGLYSSSDSPSNLRLSIKSKGDGSRKRNHAFKGYKDVSDNSKNVSNKNLDLQPKKGSFGASELKSN